MDQETNIKIVERLILKSFSFLEEQGYRPTIKHEENRGLKESLDIIYLNKDKTREITLSYVQGQQYSIFVSITRLPYSSTFEDYFSLNIYLKSIGKQEVAKSLSEFDQEQLKYSLDEIVNALKKYASGIISGTEWMPGYYPPWNE